MPSKSASQARLMAAVAHNPKFAKKVGIPVSVGKEFNKADKGKKIKEGAEVKKKDTKMFRGSESVKEEVAEAKAIKAGKISPMEYAKKERAEPEREKGMKNGKRVKRLMLGGEPGSMTMPEKTNDDITLPGKARRRPLNRPATGSGTRYVPYKAKTDPADEGYPHDKVVAAKARAAANIAEEASKATPRPSGETSESKSRRQAAYDSWKKENKDPLAKSLGAGMRKGGNVKCMQRGGVAPVARPMPVRAPVAQPMPVRAPVAQPMPVRAPVAQPVPVVQQAPVAVPAAGPAMTPAVGVPRAMKSGGKCHKGGGSVTRGDGCITKGHTKGRWI